MNDFGTIVNRETGKPVRPATAAEWRLFADIVNSPEIRRRGVFLAALDDDGREVWVDGGPEPRVGARDIVELRKEAIRAGDAAQDELCATALGDFDDDKMEAARLECVRVILDTRMNAAGDDSSEEA